MRGPPCVCSVCMSLILYVPPYVVRISSSCTCTLRVYVPPFVCFPLCLCLLRVHVPRYVFFFMCISSFCVCPCYVPSVCMFSPCVYSNGNRLKATDSYSYSVATVLERSSQRWKETLSRRGNTIHLVLCM